MLKRGAFAYLAFVLVFLFTSCSSTGSKSTSNTSNPSSTSTTSATDIGKPAVTPSEPVTVKIGGYALLSFNDPALFKKYVQDPVRKKFPNISVEFTQGARFQQMVTSGDVPDLFLFWYADLRAIAALKAVVPLDPFIKQQRFDMNTIVPSAWQSVKNLADSDQIMAMPLGFSRPAMFYNKDVFDKFGVAYPTNGMTFEQASNLGKRMDQTVDGVRYIGFHPQSIFRVEMQRNLPYTDPKTGKVAVDTEDWAKLYNMLKSIYTEQAIPQTDYTDVQSAAAWGHSRIAMLAAGQGQANNASKSNLNWDMVTYPENPEKPGYTWRDDGMLASITTGSEHKDAAFDVLQVIASPEVQTMMSEDGIIPVLADKNVQEAFGKTSDTYKGKNTKAYFALKSSPAINIPNIPNVNNIMNDYFFNNIMGNGADVNTTLRAMNDDLQKKYDLANSK